MAANFRGITSLEISHISCIRCLRNAKCLADQSRIYNSIWQLKSFNIVPLKMLLWLSTSVNSSSIHWWKLFSQSPSFYLCCGRETCLHGIEMTRHADSLENSESAPQDSSIVCLIHLSNTCLTQHSYMVKCLCYLPVYSS